MTFDYPSDGFTQGLVAGETVSWLTAERHVAFHLGTPRWNGIVGTWQSCATGSGTLFPPPTDAALRPGPDDGYLWITRIGSQRD